MTDALSLLKNRFENGQAAHAYLLESEKADIPRLLSECAKIAMCPAHGCNDCAVCRKIDGKMHADRIALPSDGEKNRLNVADVAYLVEESLKRPVDSGNVRVFTLDASDSIGGAGSTAWQNKLLKTLEEPPGNVYIFIGVEHAESLLATVVSRCQVLAADKRTVSDVLETLVRDGFRRDAAEFAAAMSEGSLSKARQVMQNVTYFETLDVAKNLLENMTSTKNAVYFLPDMLRQGVQDKILQTMTLLLRESVVYRLAPSLCILRSHEKDLLKICENFSVTAAEVCIEKIAKVQKRLLAGGNFTVEADKLTIDISEVRYRCRV